MAAGGHDNATLKRRVKASSLGQISTLQLLFSSERGIVDVPYWTIGADGVHLGREVPRESGIGLQSDQRASRLHAEIIRQPGTKGVWLIDRNSSNGSYLNGSEVTQIELSDGDIIRVGDSFLLFRLLELKTPDAKIPGLIGRAPVIQKARSLIGQVAETDANVLLLGQSGTGKGVAARAIHELSGKSGPFVTLNCSTIPEQLAESHLFGHRKGAFTGATDSRTGVFEAANGGTLFLDEVGTLPATIQSKLLVALEERLITPVGATRALSVDGRVVGATNAELAEEVENKRFRGDLWARLSDFIIEMPPLEDRPEDILPLLATALPEPCPPLDPDLVEALLLYHWPFNVRELLKLGQELTIRGKGRCELSLEMVESRLQRMKPGSAVDTKSSDSPDNRRTLPAIPNRPSRTELELLLAAHNGVLADIGRATGRSRRQVRRWLEKHGLSAEDYKK